MKERNITELIPGKKYRIEVEKGRRYDGTRNRIVETVNGTLKDAIRKRDELLYKASVQLIRPNSNISFLEFTKIWLKEYAENNIKKTTLNGYKVCLNAHILPRFKNFRLCDITAFEIEKFYNDLRETKSANNNSDGSCRYLSESTIRHQHGVISCILNTAVKWDFIPSNPCLKLTRIPKFSNQEMDFYNEEEIGVLFKYLEFENLTFRTAITLLVLGGFRRGELLGLSWNNVDFNNKTVTINRNLLTSSNGVYLDSPKTVKSNRVVSLPDVCFELLDKLKKEQELKVTSPNWVETDFVIKSEVGNYYDPTRLTKNWGVFLKKYNLKVIRLHDLRHTYATCLLNNNVPVATVSKRLGHSSATVTMNVYNHSIDKNDLIASELLNKIATNNK